MPSQAQEVGASRIGAVVDGWKLVRVLGRGGAGVVYGAARLHDDARAAIKVAERAGAVRAQWMWREASLAARLRHRNLVGVLGTGSFPDGTPYVALEEIDGPTLEAIADTLSRRDICEVGKQLLDALSYAHDAGVVHCDVTPNNVLLDGHGPALGTLKLTDFGLSVPRESRSHLGPILVAGTPGYLSPEQALGTTGVGPRADLYGAGAVLYRLIAGFPPHFGDDSTEVIRRTLQMEPMKLQPRPGLEIAPQALAVVEKLIARDPESRFSSAARARQAWVDAHEQDEKTMAANASVPAAARPTTSLVMTMAGAPFTMATRVPSHSGGSRRVTKESVAGDPRRPFAPSPNELIGRRGELELLLSHDGQEIIQLSGPAASGRSSLLDSLARQRHAQGFYVARTTGRRAISGVPAEIAAGLALHMVRGTNLAPAAAAEKLTTSLVRVGARLRGGRDALVGGALGVARPTGIGGARLEIASALEKLRPADQPLLLLVDDADQIDETSAAALRTLVERDDVWVVLSTLQDAVIPLPARIIRLGPLSDADAVALATNALEISSAEAPAAVAPFDGIPGEIVALLRPGQTGDARTSAERCYERMPEGARRVLRAAACFDGDIPERALRFIAESSSSPVDDQELFWLEDEGLIAPVHHAAARLESWVRATSPTLIHYARELTSVDERRSLALAAASWLSRECFDQSPGVQALSSDFAERGQAAATAAYAAAEAGRRAALADDPRAIPLLRRGFRLSQGFEDSVDRGALRAVLAELLVEQGEAQEAISVAEQALADLETSRDVLQARLLNIQARARTDQRRLDDAISLYQRTEEVLGRDGDPMELARAYSSHAWIVGYLQGHTEEGLNFAREALRVAAAIDAPVFRASLCGRVAAAYLRAGDWDGQLATNLQDLGLSLRAKHSMGVARAHINLGVCYTNRGLLGLARAHTEEAYNITSSLKALYALQVATSNLGMIAYEDGRIEEAEEKCQLAVSIASRRSVPVHAETWATIARLRDDSGDVAGRRHALDAMAEVTEEAEQPLLARTRALFLEPQHARELLEPVLAAGIGDPYDRATTQLALSANLAGEGSKLREQAEVVLERLGADIELERRRWTRR